MIASMKTVSFLCCLVLINLVNAQDQTGFISIDCGLTPEDSSYTETTTGLKYVSDSSYTDKGTSNLMALENRGNMMQNSESLQLYQRLDFGGSMNQTVRFPDDGLDRIWFPSTPVGSKQLSASSRNSSNSFRLPQVVMRTAIVPETTSGSVDFGWTPDDPSQEFYFYMYFTELQEPKSGERREFVLLLNGRVITEPISLDNLETLALRSSKPLTQQNFQFSLRQTRNSSLPPLINAMEAYFVKKFPQTSTDKNDLSAMSSIKSVYKVKRNWEGDTCVPQDYTWEGVNCSFSGTSMPRVTALNLASAGLTGEIVSDISRLSQLQTLDLSNNNLTGPIPAFLAQLQFLKVLNLANNQLSGPISSNLMDKIANGLSLSINGNPSICATSACEEIEQTKSKKNKLPGFVIPLVASLAGLLLIAAISVAILFILMRKKKKGRMIQRTVTASSNGYSLQRRDTGPMRQSLQRRETGFSTRPSLQRIETGMTDYEVNETAIAVDAFDLEPANRKFTYAEIVNITNGFEKDQGKVGFGRNYLGQLDGKEVTVKLVSSLSSQGYKQLRAEVKHLLRIHHRNLITMLGYCNEGDKLAVIYEYMANGNLKQHISENSSTVFSWEDRLGIAVDVAQGLEYLHTGCTPPIIHRNVKCTNVFLDEKFNAKLGGFGLSRAFDAAEGSHLNTAIAGTPGYVDPEYYTSNILTEKSDVYSFGVVLLEIVTAKPAIIKTGERMHISQWVESLLSRENIVEILDPSLCGDYDPNSAFKTVEIAVACVCRNSGDRPTMSQVVTALKESLAVEIERKQDLPVGSTDSIEDLALGFGSNPPPRLR
ncbi:hypothetical protein AALP_AA4G041800 [Arabis alpina]|uniref:non-specific serine/threonine protein kinase n=1 Tax=Arabis alpina TaxID=50452 RepID=A0A087H121_ARAAL|nr:hypothetical protein AALP_AA4G041800 [Arabis alpina]